MDGALLDGLDPYTIAGGERRSSPHSEPREPAEPETSHPLMVSRRPPGSLGIVYLSP